MAACRPERWRVSNNIRYLPPSWTKTPPVGFCAAVTLRNNGSADLPAAACPAGMKNPP